MKTTMEPADFWELRCRTLEANAEIARLKQQAAAIVVHRDAIVNRFAAKYGFDGMKTFVLDDADCSLIQDTPHDARPDKEPAATR